MKARFFDPNDPVSLLEIRWRATFSLSARDKIGKLVAMRAIHWRGHIFTKYRFILCLRPLMRPHAAIVKPFFIITPTATTRHKRHLSQLVFAGISV